MGTFRQRFALLLVILPAGARGQTGPRARPEAANQQQTPAVLLPGSYWDKDRQPLKAGEAAPSWVLPLAGDSPHSGQAAQSIDFAHWHGDKKTIVVFWAFWCDTWKDVTRYCGEVRGDLEKKHIKLVAVAIDASQQPVARPAFKSGKLFFPVVIDAHSRVTSHYGVRRVPTLFLISSRGQVEAVWEGLPPKKALRKALGD
jgi:peroxiredoxin